MKPEKRVVLEIPGARGRRRDDVVEVENLGVPPAPALVRSATTGAATRTSTLEVVEERSPEKTRERTTGDLLSVSGVTKTSTARPAIPHPKPRPTSYHPPSNAGGVSMSKGRSVSGDRRSSLIRPHRSSSMSSRKGYEPSATEPISSYQNVTGEILQLSSPPQENILAKASPPAELMPPPPQRSKTHKRASASISMVADKVFGFFTTTKPITPDSSPSRQVSAVHTIPEDTNLSRNTSVRRTSGFGGAAGGTVLSKKREKSTSSSRTEIPRSATDIFASPKSRTPSAVTVTRSPDRESTTSKMSKSRTEGSLVRTGPELLPPVRRPSESPKVNKSAKKLGELAPERASTGAARRVMEFFRRRARGLGD